LSQTLAFVDKNEFRAASAVFLKPVSDPLGDQGGVAASPVVDIGIFDNFLIET
jgi:hypothetical protein